MEFRIQRYHLRKSINLFLVQPSDAYTITGQCYSGRIFTAHYCNDKSSIDLHHNCKRPLPTEKCHKTRRQRAVQGRVGSEAENCPETVFLHPIITNLNADREYRNRNVNCLRCCLDMTEKRFKMLYKDIIKILSSCLILGVPMVSYDVPSPVSCQMSNKPVNHKRLLSVFENKTYVLSEKL